MFFKPKEHEPSHIHALYGEHIGIFDDGRDCLYDVGEDIENIKGYEDLKIIHGLFEQVQLDESRTCVFWNDFIDLPGDAIYEYGKVKAELHEGFVII